MQKPTNNEDEDNGQKLSNKFYSLRLVYPGQQVLLLLSLFLCPTMAHPHYYSHNVLIYKRKTTTIGNMFGHKLMHQWQCPIGEWHWTVSSRQAISNNNAILLIGQCIEDTRRHFVNGIKQTNKAHCTHTLKQSNGVVCAHPSTRSPVHPSVRSFLLSPWSSESLNIFSNWSILTNKWLSFDYLIIITIV